MPDTYSFASVVETKPSMNGLTSMVSDAGTTVHKTTETVPGKIQSDFGVILTTGQTIGFHNKAKTLQFHMNGKWSLTSQFLNSTTCKSTVS
jgi:hypothetical protein